MAVEYRRVRKRVDVSNYPAITTGPTEIAVPFFRLPKGTSGKMTEWSVRLQGAGQPLYDATAATNQPVVYLSLEHQDVVGVATAPGNIGDLGVVEVMEMHPVLVADAALGRVYHYPNPAISKWTVARAPTVPQMAVVKVQVQDELYANGAMLDIQIIIRLEPVPPEEDVLDIYRGGR